MTSEQDFPRKALWNDVEAWRDFVEECSVGYSDSLAEYEFDLSVRDRIQRALDDESLQAADGYERFRESVRSIDDRFLGLARVDLPAADAGSLPWWHLRVPEKGGRELADDLSLRLGVTITVIE
jgi:hypothetical protein